jgi:glycosyltransferase involved in cell wall biosynthesis
VENICAVAVRHTAGFTSLNRLIGRLAPDLVVSNSEQLFVGGMAAARLGIPHVKIFHALTFAWRLGRWPRLMRTWLAILTRSSDRIVAVSDTLAKALADGGVPAGKVSIAPNPIPVARLAAESRVPLPAELAARLEGAGPILLNVGRICPLKGQDQLVRALPIIKRKRPGLRCIFAGMVGADSGLEKAGEYQRGLVELVRREGVEENVVFLGEVDCLPSLMRRADLYVHTSWTESFGRAVAESLACGTPAVVYDSGALSETVGPGGLVVPVGDFAAMGEAVAALLSDDERRKRLAEAGKAHVASRFDADRCAGLFSQILTQAIARGGPCVV